MAELIVYFSRKYQNYVNGTILDLEKGNTEAAAGIINRLTGAPLCPLEPVREYSHEYEECTRQAKKDLQEKARPELKQYPQSLEKYDIIYLGYPNYWSTMPMAVFTFLERYDFTGKTILPFCTHEGSGMGISERDIRSCCPGAVVKPGLAIRGSDAAEAENVIRKWLEEYRPA